MNNLIVLPIAEREYAEALKWYLDQSVNAAERFDKEFDRALRQVAKNPLWFPYISERHRYHRFRKFPYLLIYRIDGETITVVSVVHTSRDSGLWENR